MANKIEFVVLGDVKDLESKLSKAKKSFDVMGKASAVALAGMTASAYGFIAAAREQEAAINALNQALMNQGNFTQEASQDLVKYASALQEVSLFGDETIIQAQAMIASFGYEGQQLKDLTRATLDLAQAKGMDLVAAADLVGKSVGSSTNALSRYGIAVDGTVGSTARASAAIDGITKLYGGQAAAATNGLGATIQLKNAMSDLAEEVGLALAPTIIDITKSLTAMVNELKQNPEAAKMAAEMLKLGIVITGSIAGVWAISSAYTAISTAVTGLIPLLAVLAANPVFLAGVALASVGGIAKATWDWAAAQIAVNKGLEEQAAAEEKMLAAYGVTKEQVMADGAMRIEIIKTVSQAEAEAAQQRIDNARRVFDDFEDMKTEMQAIAAARTQQEIDELVLKYQYEREAQVNHLLMQQELLAVNQALTAEQEEKFRQQIAEINARYDGIEYEAKSVQQSKLSALDQKGLEIAKKANQDKIGSLTSTLQQAASLNKSFANAYKAVAIGEAIMSTAAGVARAFKDYPFPASLAVAALVGAAGAVQIASIASQSFATGSAEIPRDMQANIHAGEMIVPETFSDAIRSGKLTLSGGEDGQPGGGAGSIVFDFTNSVFNGITDSFVREIFTKASENMQNRTLALLPAD